VCSSILVVDDDLAFRALATRTLTSWGYAVIAEAGTVAEALASTGRLEPEVVLLDIGLPDGDGFTLAQSLTTLPWRPRIVLMSADPRSTTDAAARGIGAAGFVFKEDLFGSLRALIEG